MHQADPPTSSGEEVPVFLRHIATLLTRGTARDKEAKHSVAVTTTIEESNLKMLVVAQNSPNARQNVSEPFKIVITTVEKSTRTLKDIYDRYHPTVYIKSTNIHAESIASALLKTSKNTLRIFSRFFTPSIPTIRETLQNFILSSRCGVSINCSRG